MRIASQHDADAVNERFNHFHDGFIKQIRLTSDSEFVTDMPWEKQRQFSSIEEELLETGLLNADTKTLELVIRHYNYDSPHQPPKRAIRIRASSARFSDKLLSFLGQDIFDLTFAHDSNGISCVLTYHDASAGAGHSMENGIKVVLCSAPEMDLTEFL